MVYSLKAFAYCVLWCLLLFIVVNIWYWMVQQVEKESELLTLPVRWKMSIYQERGSLINEFTSKVVSNQITDTSYSKFIYDQDINFATYPITNAILRHEKTSKTYGWKCENAFYKVCSPRSEIIIPEQCNALLIVQPEIYKGMGQWRSLVFIQDESAIKQDSEGLLSFTLSSKRSQVLVNQSQEPLLCMGLFLQYMTLSDFASIPPYLQLVLSKLRL